MVGTAFEGDGLQHALELEHLHLTATLFDDDHAPVLARLKRLRKLSLAETKITGASLVHLSALTQLEELNLAKTQISDASLDHLAGLKKLRLLILYDTQVTAAGAAELQKSLPNCEIQLEGSRMRFSGRG
jgi:hypothetical protein